MSGKRYKQRMRKKARMRLAFELIMTTWQDALDELRSAIEEAKRAETSQSGGAE